MSLSQKMIFNSKFVYPEISCYNTVYVSVNKQFFTLNICEYLSDYLNKKYTYEKMQYIGTVYDLFKTVLWLENKNNTLV